MSERSVIPARGGEAGYAVLAHIISAFFALSPPLDSRQVHQWHQRKTLNKAGEPFPGPVREVENPKRGQPRYMFNVRRSLAWYEAGVPLPHGKGWKIPDPLPEPVHSLVHKGLPPDPARDRTGRTER